MTTFVWIITLGLTVLLLVVAAMQPEGAKASKFELKRRSKSGDVSAEALLERETLLIDVLSLQRVFVALLLVIITVLYVTLVGWLVGIVVAVIIALQYGHVASRVGAVQRLAQWLYRRVEPALLRFAARYQGMLRLVRSAVPASNDVRLESREQLLHLVSQAGGVLTANEKALIQHGLAFGGQTVDSVMTPASVIDSIDKKELLGPLVIDDLHKTGHSRFPVTDSDLNHVVGTLHLHDLLTVDAARRTLTAEKAMEPRVFYIREDQTLAHALAAFLRTHHHLFVVVNESRETVGLLSLEDVVEALLGRKIIDEFDMHHDLRTVAARNLRGNNHHPRIPTSSVNRGKVVEYK